MEALNSVKNGNGDYVIVPNVIIDVVKMKSLIFQGQEEPITFSLIGDSPSKRSMQTIKNPESFLLNVLSAIKIVFAKCNTIVVKLLRSLPGDLEQLTHVDFDTKNAHSVKDFSEFNYSGIISIESDTKLLVSQSRKSVDIPLHSMLFFRGDMPHAGAGYSKKNKRLFLSVSSDKFPVTENVFIVN